MNQQKKEITEQIDRMETGLAEKHKLEIEEFKASCENNQQESSLTEESNPESIRNVEEGINGLELAGGRKHESGKSRQQKRKEKKAAELEELRRAAEAEALLVPDMKKIEQDDIHDLVDRMQLKIKEINADGHCLYNALVDQLNLDEDLGMDYKKLREIAAKYILEHSGDFKPFLVNENGDMMSDKEFASYCDRVQNEAVWGGQLEIQAISQALRVPIHIVQRGSPIIKIGDEFANKKPLFVS